MPSRTPGLPLCAGPPSSSLRDPGGQTEAQRGDVTHPRSHSSWRVRLRVQAGLPTPNSVFLILTPLHSFIHSFTHPSTVCQAVCVYFFPNIYPFIWLLWAFVVALELLIVACKI